MKAKTKSKTSPKNSGRPEAAALLKEARIAAKKGSTRAEALVALILRRKQRIVEDFFDIGEALRTLHHEKLFATLGYKTFEEMLDARKLIGHAQAYKLVAIVSSYSRDQAIALGLEKSFAVLTYAAATPSHQVPQLVVTEGIGGKPLSRLTVKEINAKTKALRVRAGKSSPAEKHAHKLAVSWQRLLRATGFHNANVSVHQTGGRLMVDAQVAVDVLEHAIAKVRE
jgi:hypothetical protein